MRLRALPTSRSAFIALFATTLSIALAFAFASEADAKKAKKPTFPKSFVGKVHVEAKGTEHLKDVTDPVTNYLSFVDIVGARFTRYAFGNWGSKNVPTFLRNRPYADYRLTGGTATFVSQLTGDCSHYVTETFKATAHGFRYNIFSVTPLAKGRWFFVARVLTKQRKGPVTTTTCASTPAWVPPPTPKAVAPMPMLLLTGDQKTKSIKPLRGTNQPTDNGSTTTWTWDLNPAN